MLHCLDVQLGEMWRGGARVQDQSRVHEAEGSIGSSQIALTYQLPALSCVKSDFTPRDGITVQPLAELLEVLISVFQQICHIQ